jgi:hypothetical protein
MITRTSSTMESVELRLFIKQALLDIIGGASDA